MGYPDPSAVASRALQKLNFQPQCGFCSRGGLWATGSLEAPCSSVDSCGQALSGLQTEVFRVLLVAVENPFLGLSEFPCYVEQAGFRL